MDNDLPANWADNLIAGAAKWAESPQERHARYLRILDRFGDSIPPSEKMAIKAELAKSLMGES